MPGSEGAYLCHAGCSSEAIRAALGQPKPTPSQVQHDRKPKRFSRQELAEWNKLLLKSPTSDAKAARIWLEKRGFSPEMIQHYQLVLSTNPVGIGIPIPVEDNAKEFLIKIRRAPWDKAETIPWSQWGIPATVLFTYRPEDPRQTWLCEGEWDAMLVGWQLRQSQNRTTAVATFTCGCSAIPKQEQLDRLV